VDDSGYLVQPIGWIESPLTDRSAAPKQGDENAPAARIKIDSRFRDAARDLRPGDGILLLTWLHLSDRTTLAVRPRGDESRPITGVFSTRSPDRPNPIGLHAVRIESVGESSITVGNLEAIDGTPVLDIKPVLRDPRER
jgi:tRNA-Thr(GGU) m(6)t(6)A37 methyltransferase TsaA